MAYAFIIFLFLFLSHLSVSLTLKPQSSPLSLTPNPLLSNPNPHYSSTLMPTIESGIKPDNELDAKDTFFNGNLSFELISWVRFRRRWVGSDGLGYGFRWMGRRWVGMDLLCWLLKLLWVVGQGFRSTALWVEVGCGSVVGFGPVVT